MAPVLFRQTRVGRNGALFTLRKLRSMRRDAEAESGPQWAAVNDPRVTRVGRWIRALRIDEIPQAWNVLRGDMSFVGPRPERPEFVRHLARDHSRTTNTATTCARASPAGRRSISRTAASVEDPAIKHAYDLYYLDAHLGCGSTSLILLRTVKIILLGWGSR